MSVEKIIREINEQKYYPVYFLMGDEAFYIDQIVQKLERSVVPQEAQSFDKTVFYGLDTKMEQVLLQARQYPMLSKNQLVIVKEAQHLLPKIEALEAYLEHPAPQTLLVFACKGKRLDLRKSVAKRLGKIGLLFDSKKLYDNQIPAFIENLLYLNGFKANQQAIMLLSNHLGSDLSKINSELNKLKILMPNGGVLQDAHIEQHIGISKQFNYFEWYKALSFKDVEKSYAIAAYFSRNSKNFPLVLTLTMLYRYFVKILRYYALESKDSSTVMKALELNYYTLKEYQQAFKNYPLKKVTRIFSYLRHADAQLKGLYSVNPKEENILKELLFKILN